MAYNANIPNANDQMDVSQGQIKANFQSLDNVSDGYIKFKELTLAPTIPVTTTGLYSFLNSTTAQQELYMKRITVDAPTTVPVSASKMSTVAIASCDNGWSYAGGLLMKWGTVPTHVTGGNISVDVATTSGGPNFTRALTVQITPDVSGITFTQFKAFKIAAGTFSNTTTGNFVMAVDGGTASGSGTKTKYLVIGV